MMTGSQLRQLFLTFFEKRGHTRVPSAPLVPKDKSLLFNIAGMVPFKPYFLGEVAPPFPRAVSSQKCIRTNDIERVGTTARHLTFFEMLGNFSFGDYFKREAIGWGWEFLTREVGLPANLLYATVYEKDEDAHRLWGEIAGLPASRIVRLGREHNFWEVGPTGPCGPCSEILYDHGPEYSCGQPTCAPGCDCDRYMEVWNLVFMEFNQVNGNLAPLPKKNIDTGMGLERLASILQGKKTNFETDLIHPLIDEARAIPGVAGAGPNDRRSQVAFNVIGDHLRATVFLLADGVRPSNEDRGYVLRRLIRRAAAAMRRLGRPGPALHELVPCAAELFGDAFPELKLGETPIRRELLAEEERFARTLDVGMERVSRVIGDLRRSSETRMPGDEAFLLYDTYGFPLDLTEDLLLEEGFTVDRPEFERLMEEQKSRARAAFTAAHGGAEAMYVSVSEPTVFVGYDSLRVDAAVAHLAREGRFVETVQEGESMEFLADKTPFYAERGGQVGDQGAARSDSAEIRVDGCMPVGKVSVHRGTVTRGTVRVGDRLTLEVDANRRGSIMKNHTGTHLLHAALRIILGDHVRQAGSLVAPARLRFDFSHSAALGDQSLEVEALVNGWIQDNLPVMVSEMSMPEAKDSGALMLFDEKYGARVRVVRVGSGESVELCGGTHCRSTGEIGFFKIISDSALAAGVRRIDAVSGPGAVRYVQDLARDVRAFERATRVPLGDAAGLFEKIQKEKKDLEKKLKESRQKGGSAEDLTDRRERLGDLAYIVTETGETELDVIRGMAERLRDKIAGPVFLGSRSAAGAQLVMAVPKTLTDRFHAGKIIGQVAVLVGGRGGGRPDFAQAGGKDAGKLPEALNEARRLITQTAS